VTGLMATLPVRKPSALLLQPLPSAVIIPTPVMTTRGGWLEVLRGGKSTAQIGLLGTLEKIEAECQTAAQSGSVLVRLQCRACGSIRWTAGEASALERAERRASLGLPIGCI
jgi:hypothetical protein